MMTDQPEQEAIILKLPLGRWGTNCYVLVCPQTRESIIVDPADEATRILEAAQDTRVGYILLTHGHGDHIQALGEVKRATGAPLGIHPADAEMIPLAPDFALSDGQVIPFGNQRLRVIHTPGHTPGSVCLLVGRYLLGGDTLFPGGPGATRTPEALTQIVESITQRLFLLPDDTPVYSGHGDSTTLGQEKEAYAHFLERHGGRLPADLCGDVLWESS